MSNVVAVPVVETVKSVFNFSVDKFPLSGPDNMKTGVFGLFRSDSGEFIGRGSVTKIYVPHQTDDVLALVESAAEAFDGVGDVKCHFNNGHYVVVQPSREYRLNVFGTVDNVVPRLVIRAGYDMKAFSASVAMFRDMCKNLHIMRTVSSTTVSINHTSGLRSKMNELIRTFGVLKNSWATLGSVIAHMEATRVNLPAFLDAVYGQPVAGDTTRAETIHRNRTEAIIRRIMNEQFAAGRDKMTSDMMVTGWEALNAVQGYTQHTATRRGGVGDFQRMLLAHNDASVAKAENYVRVAMAS
jgi:hypothetical protein